MSPVSSDDVRLGRWTWFGAAVRNIPANPSEVCQTRLNGGNLPFQPPSNWPVRDQWQRGTCVAFATTACVELFLYRQTKQLLRLSEQFLQYETRHSATALGRPSQDRTWLADTQGVLTDIGICPDAAWPYHPVDTVPSENFPPPSSAAVNQATPNKISAADLTFFGDQDGAHGHAGDLLAALRNKAVAAIAIPVYAPSVASPNTNNWSTAAGRGLGIVDDPPDTWTPWDLTDPMPDGHAVCVVGFYADKKERMGGWFIFRNSWNSRWATDVPSNQPSAVDLPGKGYGVISASYVDRFCSEMLILGSPAMKPASKAPAPAKGVVAKKRRPTRPKAPSKA
jgi:hypothetical protein